MRTVYWVPSNFVMQLWHHEKHSFLAHSLADFAKISLLLKVKNRGEGNMLRQCYHLASHYLCQQDREKGQESRDEFPFSKDAIPSPMPTPIPNNHIIGDIAFF
jgi:hypothetical protein